MLDVLFGRWLGRWLREKYGNAAPRGNPPLLPHGVQWLLVVAGGIVMVMATSGLYPQARAANPVGEFVAAFLLGAAAAAGLIIWNNRKILPASRLVFDGNGLPDLSWWELERVGGQDGILVRRQRRCWVELTDAGPMFCHSKDGVIERRAWAALESFALVNENEHFGSNVRAPQVLILAGFGLPGDVMEVSRDAGSRATSAQLHGLLSQAFVKQQRGHLERLQTAQRSAPRNLVVRMSKEDRARRGHEGTLEPLEGADLKLRVIPAGNLKELEELARVKGDEVLGDWRNWQYALDVLVPLLGVEEGTLCRQAVRVLFLTGDNAIVLGANAPPMRKAKGATDYTMGKGIPLEHLEGFEVRLASEWNDARFRDFAWCPGERVLLARESGRARQLVLRGGLSDVTELDKLRAELAHTHGMLRTMSGLGGVSSAVPDNV